MEKEYGYTVIKVEEYRDLIEKSFYYDDVYNENEILKNKISELELSLKDKINELQKILLETNIDNWDLKHGDIEDLIDVSSTYFPFRKEFISKLDMPLKDVIAFILDKKEKILEKEKEEQENE